MRFGGGLGGFLAAARAAGRFGGRFCRGLGHGGVVGYICLIRGFGAGKGWAQLDQHETRNVIAHADDGGTARIVAATAPTLIVAGVTAAAAVVATAFLAPGRGLRLGCGGLGGLRLGRAVVIAAAAAIATAAAAFAVVARTRGRASGFGWGKAFGRGAAGQCLLDQILDRRQQLFISGRPDRDRGALAASATGAADAVDIVLGMAGQVEVEHMADGGNVQPARGHVRGDQQFQLAIAEAVQRAGAVALVQIAVDRGRVIAMRFQRLGKDVHIGLAVAEDDGVGQRLALAVDDGAQQFALLLRGLILAGGGQLDQLLGDRLAGGGLTRDLDPFGGVQEGVGDPLDLGRHGGAEEQRLTGEGRQLEDAFDIGDETHVQHPVGLVHDHDLHAGQQQLAAFEMVQQPARGRDQHIDATVDQLVLFRKRHTADQQRLGQAGMLGIDVEILGHLRGQFPRRAQHEAARHTRARAATAQQGDHRQGKAGGLAGAGLGDSQHVAAFQRRGDRARLNRGRGFITRLGDGGQDLRVQLEVGEFRH